MRLRRVEAVRYGRLADDTLGDLGDGLTVVVGPNESGKSTYTSLVRHVLYGYPTARDREPGYAVPGDGRRARLVFTDDGGSWVIERTEGTHGGTVTVRTLSGPERPALLAELTRGVSPLAYRMVFGFGLDEMAGIEEQRGREDDIIARLYAASTGVRVSPHEVRAALEKEAQDVFAPSARKREVNTLLTEIRTTRAALRDLRADDEIVRDDQARLASMAATLAERRVARDAARTRTTELAVAMERADERLGTIAQQEEALIGLRLELKQLADEFAGLAVDERLLGAGPELDALLEEAAGHAQAVQALADDAAQDIRLRGRAADAVAATGLEPSTVAALGSSPDLTATVEEARDDLQRLSLQLETRNEAVGRAAASLEQARAAVERLLGSMAIVADDPAEEVAERLAALEALEARRAAFARPGTRSIGIPAIIMLVSGLAAVGVGAVLREWITAAIGAVLVGAGLWYVLRSRAGLAVTPEADEAPYLRVLGLNGDAGALELSRARRTLEQARSALGVLREADARHQDASQDATLAADALAARAALWSEWLVAHGFGPDLRPAQVAGALALVREATAATLAAAEAAEDLARRTERLDAFAERFGEVVCPLLDVPHPPGREGVPALANRLRESLAGARAAAARRSELAQAIAALDARILGEEERASRARADVRGLLERFDLAEGGTHEDLRLLHAAAVREETDATVAYDDLAAEMNQVEGRLEKERREHRSASLQLDEAAQVERLTDAIDRYIVRATAARLLADTQERYERERQPEVVRTAGRLFSTITGGRYTGLNVPLGDGRIEAFDTHAAAYTSDILSRGTAEQLYLAIRLGLIGQLGEVGRGLPVLMDDVFVNFDDDRKRGAAEAVAEVAEQRQIVFFTCHPETAALFEAAAPGHVRIELPRLGS
jgi:uncharacterized protein YhaN